MTLRFGAIVPVATGLDLAAVAAYARRLEEAGFSALIVGDGALADDGVSFEPLTLVSALATLTDRIGLVPSVSTDFNEPFHVARRLATLDHLSGGRAGWNVVTDAVPRPVGGFVRAEHDAHADRADEFLRVVRGLWDSYADDALVADKRSGLYFRPGGRRPLDHAGRHFQVAGPLNVSRSPQGHPVVFHQVASTAEIDFAARYADVLVVADRSIEASRRTRARLDDALAAAGRDPASVQVWPQITPVVVSTEREATERHATAGPPIVAGTPEQVAGRIDEWHRSGSVDGFAVNVPDGADPFLDEVLPLLRSHRPAGGATLRDCLGLARPERSAV